MPTVTATNVAADPVAHEFDEIFREHYPMLYRTAYGVTGRIEDAEDIIQTILLQLVRGEISLDSKRNPRGYLYRTAINLALSVVRRRRRFVEANDLEKVATVKPASDEELHRRLYAAIAKLKPKAAEILILRYVHNYTD